MRRDVPSAPTVLRVRVRACVLISAAVASMSLNDAGADQRTFALGGIGVAAETSPLPLEVSGMATPITTGLPTWAEFLRAVRDRLDPREPMEAGSDVSSPVSFASAAAAGSRSSRGTVSLLTNPSFEAPAILSAGQTDLQLNQEKWITIDASGPYFRGSISGIQGWSIGLDGGPAGVHVDAGGSRISFVDGSRGVFINRWARPFHQTAGVVEASTTYHGSLKVGAFGPSKAGRVRIIGGAIDAYGSLTPGSIILVEQTFGTADWTGVPPAQVIPSTGWSQVNIDYTAPASGAVVGKPLVFAFSVDTFCVGPMKFDAAALSATPPCSGDIDGDGVVGMDDYVILMWSYGTDVTPNTGGDLNGDGLVNAADFVILAGDFGCGAP